MPPSLTQFHHPGNYNGSEKILCFNQWQRSLKPPLPPLPPCTIITTTTATTTTTIHTTITTTTTTTTNTSTTTTTTTTTTATTITTPTTTTYFLVLYRNLEQLFAVLIQFACSYISISISCMLVGSLSLMSSLLSLLMRLLLLFTVHNTTRYLPRSAQAFVTAETAVVA